MWADHHTYTKMLDWEIKKRWKCRRRLFHFFSSDKMGSCQRHWDSWVGTIIGSSWHIMIYNSEFAPWNDVNNEPIRAQDVTVHRPQGDSLIDRFTKHNRWNQRFSKHGWATDKQQQLLNGAPCLQSWHEAACPERTRRSMFFNELMKVSASTTSQPRTIFDQQSVNDDSSTFVVFFSQLINRFIIIMIFITNVFFGCDQNLNDSVIFSLTAFLLFESFVIQRLQNCLWTCYHQEKKTKKKKPRVIPVHLYPCDLLW